MENKIDVAPQYAIFQAGGKQYQAIPGKTVVIEKIDGNVGDTIEFDTVLFRKRSEKSFEIGAPFVTDAVLKGSIVKHTLDAKIIVFRHKRRKKSRVRKGHRQQRTVIRIESIG